MLQVNPVLFVNPFQRKLKKKSTVNSDPVCGVSLGVYPKLCVILKVTNISHLNYNCHLNYNMYYNHNPKVRTIQISEESFCCKQLTK